MNNKNRSSTPQSSGGATPTYDEELSPVEATPLFNQELSPVEAATIYYEEHSSGGATYE